MPVADEVVPVITKGVLPIGKHDFAEIPIAEDKSAVTLKFDRTDLTDASASLIATIETTLDGVQWDFLCRATIAGGVLLDRNKKPLPYSSFQCPRLQDGKARKARGSVEVLEGVVNTKADVIVGTLPEFSKVTTHSVGFDAASTMTGVGISNLNWAHPTSGADRLIVCTAHIYSSTSGVISGTPTYNSLNLTFKDSETPAADHLQSMWFRIAPTTGSHAADFVFTTSDVIGVGGCTSFTGTHQTTPLGTTAKQNSDLTIGAACTVPTNGLCLDIAFTAGAATQCEDLVPSGSQTERYDVCADNGPGNSMVAGSSTATSSITMTWGNHTGANHGQMTVPISEVAAGGTAVRHWTIIIQ